MPGEVPREVNCPKIGKVNVFVRGNIGSNETLILTVHDLGCNHRQYDVFIEHPAMEQLRQRCTFVHVEVPGQGDDAVDLPAAYNFPTMQDIADDLSHVMDVLEIKQAVLFGEGAGANILARLAMREPSRVFGALLIHCTGSSAGVLEAMRDKVIGWKANPEQYLVVHRFGPAKLSQTAGDMRTAIENYKQSLKTTRNAKNLQKFINAFMTRNNITERLTSLTCPLLLATGSLAAQHTAAQALFQALQKVAKADPQRRRQAEFVQVENCANILLERPDKMAECFQYFMQGLGLVSGVVSRKISNARRLSGPLLSTSPKSPSAMECASADSAAGAAFRDDGTYEDSSPNRSVGGARTRRLSMEEADQPKAAEQVVYNPSRKYSSSVVMPPAPLQETSAE